MFSMIGDRPLRRPSHSTRGERSVAAVNDQTNDFAAPPCGLPGNFSLKALKRDRCHELEVLGVVHLSGHEEQSPMIASPATVTNGNRGCSFRWRPLTIAVS
jgi:hypothetical protein